MMGTATFTRVVKTRPPRPNTPTATIHSVADGRYSLDRPERVRGHSRDDAAHALSM